MLGCLLAPPAGRIIHSPPTGVRAVGCLLSPSAGIALSVKESLLTQGAPSLSMTDSCWEVEVVGQKDLASPPYLPVLKMGQRRAIPAPG